MKLAELRDDEKSALYYAEGWLSAGYGGTFLAAWNGARYNSPKKLGIGNLLSKALLAMKVKRSLDERGLKKGFDIKTLRT